jgi:hypothetical protein
MERHVSKQRRVVLRVVEQRLEARVAPQAENIGRAAERLECGAAF